MSPTTPTSPPHGSFGIAIHSTSVLRHGYLFWEVMRRRSGSQIVQTRLLHERVTAIRGPEAAQFFYEEPGTERATALPTALVGALFGRGPVHTLDGGAHAHRKSLFNGLLGVEASGAVVDGLARRWDERSPAWNCRVDIFQQVGEMLLESVCDWVGIELPTEDVPRRTRDMLAMVDGFGAPSRRQLSARLARRRTDAWFETLVDAARRADPAGSTPLDVVARHRDENGDLLSTHTAAVEAINLVRPLVAVSWLVGGLLEAFDAHPQVRSDVLAEQVSAMDVAQEVRRTHPFVPFLATRATRHLHWQGVTIPEGTLVVLDVWGTNHDPRIWHDPYVFDPSRFSRTPVTPYNLVPQGGGSRLDGHRCPGEDMTLAALMTLVERVAALSAPVVGPRATLRRMPPAPRLEVHVQPVSGRAAP